MGSNLESLLWYRYFTLVVFARWSISRGEGLFVCLREHACAVCELQIKYHLFTTDSVEMEHGFGSVIIFIKPHFSPCSTENVKFENIIFSTTIFLACSYALAILILVNILKQ